jgi:hypothetical protein
MHKIISFNIIGQKLQDGSKSECDRLEKELEETRQRIIAIKHVQQHLRTKNKQVDEEMIKAQAILSYFNEVESMQQSTALASDGTDCLVYLSDLAQGRPHCFFISIRIRTECLLTFVFLVFLGG